MERRQVCLDPSEQGRVIGAGEVREVGQGKDIPFYYKQMGSLSGINTGFSQGRSAAMQGMN